MTDRQSVDDNRIREANRVARRHFDEFQWPTIALAAVLFAAYWLVVVTTVAGPLPLMAGVVLAAVVSYPVYVCYHEAVHGNLGRRGRGRLNEVVGLPLAQVLGVPLLAHRKEHLAHHAFTNRAGADPDAEAFPDGRFTLRGSLYMFFSQYGYFRRQVWPGAGRGERVWFWAELVVMVGWRLGLVMLFGWTALVLLVASSVLTIVILSFLLVYLVHNVPEPLDEGRWIDTISYRIDDLSRPAQWVIRAGWMGHHVHGVHHLYPGVPFYRQQRVFDRIGGLMTDLGAPVRTLRRWRPIG